MKNQMKIPALAALGVALILPLSAFAQAAEPSVDPAADAALQAMSDKLAAAGHLTITGTRTMEASLLPDAGIKHEARVQVKLSRPAGIVAVATNASGTRELFFDGKRVVVVDRQPGVFAEVEFAGTNDEVIDELADRWGIEPALADLLVSDPHSSLTSAVESGRVVGVETVAGTECDHLAFSLPGLEWEVWIGKSDSLPRRFLIRYTDLENQPTITAELETITIETAHDPAVFSPQQLEDMQQIEILPKQSISEME